MLKMRAPLHTPLDNILQALISLILGARPFWPQEFYQKYGTKAIVQGQHGHTKHTGLVCTLYLTIALLIIFSSFGRYDQKNTVCCNSYFLRHSGTKQKRGRLFVAINHTQFWGHYGNDTCVSRGIHSKCHVAVMDFKPQY